MKYKCITKCFINDAVVMNPGDIIVINDNKLFNVTTGIDYRNISSTNTYIAVDVDGVRKYQSDVIQSGMQPDDFVIDVTGAQDLTISIEGRNFARLADISLK